MTFNEDSRVKIPAILHLCRLGYTYIPKSKQDRLEDHNIFPDIFKRSISKINPDISEDEVQRLLTDVSLKLNYDDLGREFFRMLMNTSGTRLIDFENFNNNEFHVIVVFEIFHSHKVYPS